MSECLLAERLRAGETDAVEQIVIDHSDRLFRSAMLLCGNPSRAEDLVQETFFQACRSATRFRGTSAIFTWLYGILLNVHRKQSRKAFRLVFRQDLPEDELDPEQTPDRSADADAIAALVADQLLKLSVKHREVIVLHYYEHASVEEMARILQVGKGTVKSRLHYARERLRILLPEELNLIS